MIQSYSTYQKNSHLKNQLWKRIWIFALKTIYFGFAEIYDSEFFHEDTGTATNNNNTIYNKTQERTDMSKQLKNRSFRSSQDHCDKLN